VTNGQELAEEFPTEVEAGQAPEVIAQAKRRCGYQDLYELGAPQTSLPPKGGNNCSDDKSESACCYDRTPVTVEVIVAVHGTTTLFIQLDVSNRPIRYRSLLSD
jgi:hypothetical protein